MTAFGTDNPYDILGVPPNAARGDIKRAFRRLAKVHHPDRNPDDPDAARRYAALSDAHDLLCDPERRAAYDEGLLRGDYRRAGASQGEARFQRRDAGARFRTHGADLHYTITISFDEALHGVRKRVRASDGAMFDLAAPPGTRTGDILRLHGQGEESSIGGRYGDALVEIAVAPHDVFALSGDDVYRDLQIALHDAVFGATVEVETPDGVARIKAPPNSNSGDVLRIRGKGFPKANKKDRGDLLLKLLVMLPDNEDGAFAELLREWESHNMAATKPRNRRKH